HVELLRQGGPLHRLVDQYNAAKVKLAIAIAALLMATSAAHAAQRQVVVTKTRMVPIWLAPPPAYDKPYEGNLEIKLFASFADLQIACKGAAGGEVGACAGWSLDHKTCMISAMSEQLTRQQGRNYAFMLRHELAHCNGWKHAFTYTDRKLKVGDSEPDGSKWLPSSTKMAMPTLPAS